MRPARSERSRKSTASANPADMIKNRAQNIRQSLYPESTVAASDSEGDWDE